MNPRFVRHIGSSTVCSHSNWQVRESCAACEHPNSPLNLSGWQTGMVRALRSISFDEILDFTSNIERGRE